MMNLQATAEDILQPAIRRRSGSRLAFRWLGQAGFAFQAGGSFFLIDPYLSDSLHEKYRGGRFPHERLHPPPARPQDLEAVDLVLCTHGHTDHLDPGTLPILQERNPSCRFVVPAAETTRAVDSGLRPERLLPMDAGQSLTLEGGLAVTALPSAHEELRTDKAGRHLFLGYLIEWAGRRLYHSGDCVPYTGLAERVRELQPGLLFLPINGRSEELRAQGIAGNFTPAEAAELTLAAGGNLLVGHHFGLFAFNTADPRQARRILTGYEPRGLRWLLPELAASYVAYQD